MYCAHEISLSSLATQIASALSYATGCDEPIAIVFVSCIATASPSLWLRPSCKAKVVEHRHRPDAATSLALQTIVT
jgi:hypothetical protein